MTEAIQNNMANQQQPVRNDLQPISYNAVQINMKTPTVNVEPPRPLPPTATQQWQA